VFNDNANVPYIVYVAAVAADADINKTMKNNVTKQMNK